jgi:hypothetical protein
MTKYFRNGPGHIGARHRLDSQESGVIQQSPSPVNPDKPREESPASTVPIPGDGLIGSRDNTHM